MRYLIFIALLSLGFSSSIYGQVSESCIDTYSTTHTYSNDDYSNLGGVILYDNSLSSNICDGGYINETGELITINSVTYESTYDIVVHYPDLSQVLLDVEFIDIEFHCDATFSEILCNPITGGSPTFTQYQFNYAYSSVKMYLVYDWYQDEPEGNWQLMLAESTFTEGDFLLDSQQLSEEHLGRLEETIQPANSTISDILYTRMLNAIEEFVVPEIEDSSPDCHEWCSLYGLVYDECGICNGSGIPDGDCDCEGNILDECGVCGGTGIPEGDCDCDGNVLDECGFCGGDNSTCLDCCGVVNGDGTTCDGACGPCGEGIPEGKCDCDGNILDECSVCGGSGIPEGDCDCDGNILDDCGVCGGINECCPGPGCCSEGLYWDWELEQCFDINPTDTNLDGCTDLNDLMDILANYGDCAVAVFTTCGDDIEHEGYDYSTVLIGEQCWFAENCRFLPAVSSGTANSLESPHAYVYDYTGSDVGEALTLENYNTYGALYNFVAVEQWELCPVGWSVPSDDQFIQLEISAGLNSEEADSTGWRGSQGSDFKSLIWGGTDALGFGAIPSGYKNDVSNSQFFNQIDYACYWWTSSPSIIEDSSQGTIEQTAMEHSLFSDQEGIARVVSNRRHGFSARCVRD